MAPLEQQEKVLVDAGLEGIVACTSAICTEDMISRDVHWIPVEER
jgi:hypothetical protein